MTYQFIRTTIALDVLEVWLVFNLIEILVQFVQKIIQKLLAILMIVSPELRILLYNSKYWRWL